MSFIFSPVGFWNPASPPFYVIKQSILFNDDDSAHMTRVLDKTATSNTDATLSLWAKFCTKGGDERIIDIAAAPGATSEYVRVTRGSTGKIGVEIRIGGATKILFWTDAELIDTTAWYHIAVTIDLSNGTAADRVIIYINGVRATLSTSTNNTSGSEVSLMNDNGSDHYIGRNFASSGSYVDGYFAEFVWIDGTVQDITAFGEFDANGVWVPVDVSGLTFGANGYHITGANSAVLGTDYSGNGNNFTTSGLITADQMLDTPTDSLDLGVGNFCNWSPLIKSDLTITYSNGNLTCAVGNDSAARGSMQTGDTGKYYFEITVTTSGTYDIIGLQHGYRVCDILTGGDPGALGKDGYAWSSATGLLRHENVYSAASPVSTYTTGDILGFYIDFDNDAIWLSKNGTLQNGASQAEVEAGTTTNAVWTGTLAGSGGITPVGGDNGAAAIGYLTLNCGQSAFNTALYTGYGGIGTVYLPAPGAGATPMTGSFTGTVNADGPVVWLGFAPDVSGISTINGNVITWGTHADALSNGFKVITTSTLYNSTGTNTISVAVKSPFGGVGVSQAKAQ